TLVDRSRFEDFSDHRILRHLFNQRKLNMRQHKWQEFPKNYYFDLSHHLDLISVFEVTLEEYEVGYVKGNQWFDKESKEVKNHKEVVTFEHPKMEVREYLYRPCGKLCLGQVRLDLGNEG
ncbi:hypothetical protein CR513_47633, partial [Mucuna pruriens]